MITDNLLVDMSKLFKGDSVATANYIDFSDSSSFSLDSTASSVLGSLGRISSTKARDTTEPEVLVSGVRNGTTVSSGGDTIYGAALLPSDSNSGVQALASVPGILHTSSFDLQVDWTIEFERV